MKTAWLLEAPGPKWIGLRDDGYFEWVTDANRARHYDDEAHARGALVLFDDDDFTPAEGLLAEVGGVANVKPTEHGWPGLQSEGGKGQEP